jgi:hypothetical protein
MWTRSINLTYGYKNYITWNSYGGSRDYVVRACVRAYVYLCECECVSEYLQGRIHSVTLEEWNDLPEIKKEKTLKQLQTA